MTACKHCTQPTDSGDVCTFCADYVPPTDTATELLYLKDTLAALRDAKSSAACAADELDGSRAARARELVDVLRTAIAFTDRLAMVCEGDLRSR